MWHFYESKSNLCPLSMKYLRKVQSTRISLQIEGEKSLKNKFSSEISDNSFLQ